MKRSEWLKLLDVMDEMNGGPAYPNGEWELGYYSGIDHAYDSSRDALDYAVREFVVDVEDVELCPSTTVFPDTKKARQHAVGSKPFAHYFHADIGCHECRVHWDAAQAAKT